MNPKNNVQNNFIILPLRQKKTLYAPESKITSFDVLAENENCASFIVACSSMIETKIE